MKQTFLAFFLFLTAISAQATSLITPKVYQLNDVTVQGQIEKRFVSLATADFTKNTMTIEVFDDICGSYNKGMNDGLVFTCLAMPILIEEHTLPMKVQKDLCGNVIYTGTQDNRPADGLKVQFRLEDRSEEFCDGFKQYEAELLMSVQWYSRTPGDTGLQTKQYRAIKK